MINLMEYSRMNKIILSKYSQDCFNIFAYHFVMQLKTEFDKLFEDLKEDDKTREVEAAEVHIVLNKLCWFILDEWKHVAHV